MAHIVKITNEGGDHWLRGTTWTFSAERANRFETEDAARAALTKARRFMKASQFKLARIVEAPTLCTVPNCGQPFRTACTMSTCPGRTAP